MTIEKKKKSQKQGGENKEEQAKKHRAEGKKERTTCMGTYQTQFSSPLACGLLWQPSSGGCGFGLSNQTSLCKNGNRIGWILLCKYIDTKHSKYP